MPCLLLQRVEGYDRQGVGPSSVEEKEHQTLGKMFISLSEGSVTFERRARTVAHTRKSQKREELDQ